MGRDKLREQSHHTSVTREPQTRLCSISLLHHGHGWHNWLSKTFSDLQCVVLFFQRYLPYVCSNVWRAGSLNLNGSSSITFSLSRECVKMFSYNNLDSGPFDFFFMPLSRSSIIFAQLLLCYCCSPCPDGWCIKKLSSFILSFGQKECTKSKLLRRGDR